MATLASFPRPGRAPDPAATRRQAIIDIGSNSIRLVVFDTPARFPAVLFNEKVMAGLGRSLSDDGRLDKGSTEVAIRALERFHRLAQEMGVRRPRTVATAAVRDASDGAAFLARVAALGIGVDLLSGVEEAEAAGYGVISAIPDADGVVGDLGGGSLELIRVCGGATRQSVSLPLGVLRIAAIREAGRDALRKAVNGMLADQGWLADARDRPFYMVGGSWRTLARLDMILSDYPLPVIHHYRMEPERAQHLVRSLAALDRKRLQALPQLSNGRIPTLGDAAVLLAELVRQIGSSELVVSAAGLREGLLYAALGAAARTADPLIEAARAEGVRQGRFPEHGDLLDRWIAPLFEDEPPAIARIRHAACLLADVGWRANPEFRAERGVETALHGNWVGIDAAGRAMMAQALATSFGAGAAPLAGLTPLASEDALNSAVLWGLAMRLGQRFSGGVAAPLVASRLQIEDDALVLRLDRGDTALYGEAVERRHRQLAGALGLTHRLAADARLF